MLTRKCDICGKEIQNPYRHVFAVDNPPWAEISCKIHGLSQLVVEEDCWERRELCMDCYYEKFKPLCNPKLFVYRNGISLTETEYSQEHHVNEYWKNCLARQDKEDI